MPTHHNLDEYLTTYIAAAGISEDRKGPLFRTTRGRSNELTGNALLQSDVWRMRTLSCVKTHKEILVGPSR